MSADHFSPLYSIRISTRARHVRLHIRPRTGLEIVLPTDVDPQCIPEILHTKRQWIEKHVSPQSSCPRPQELPEQIFFPSISEFWKVSYTQTSGPRYAILQKKAYEISLEGPDQNADHMASLLTKWLIVMGQKHLPAWLLRVQKSRNLPAISRIQVRVQKTRWGSCSSKGTISLNAKLLFLEPKTVEYIFIHELCHRLHMDHSSLFWNEVARHVPDFQEHEAKMKQAWEHMPIGERS